MIPTRKRSLEKRVDARCCRVIGWLGGASFQSVELMTEAEAELLADEADSKMDDVYIDTNFEPEEP